MLEEQEKLLTRQLEATFRLLTAQFKSLHHVSGILILHDRHAALNTDWLIVLGVQLHLFFFMLFKEHNAIIIDCMDCRYPQNW